jgi:hypothetical protein
MNPFVEKVLFNFYIHTHRNKESLTFVINKTLDAALVAGQRELEDGVAEIMDKYRLQVKI